MMALVQAPPTISNTLPELEVRCSDVFTENNPFAIFVQYNQKNAEAIDQLVQQVGQKFQEDDHADEPDRWVLVKHSQKWYRAEVLNLYNDENEEREQAEVVAIDFGYRWLVGVRQIFQTNSRVFDEPAQCVRLLVKNITVTAAHELQNIFRTHDKMKLRIKFDRLPNNGLQQPYLHAAIAKVTIGYDKWMSLEDFCLDNELAVSFSQRSGSRAVTSSNPIAIQPESESVDDEDDEEADEEADASDESDMESPYELVHRSSPYEGISRPSEGRGDDDDEGDVDTTTDDEGNRPYSSMMNGAEEHRRITEKRMLRSLDDAKRKGKQNELRIRKCREYRLKGECPRGDACCLLHSDDVTAVHTIGDAEALIDFREISLPFDQYLFAVCTHVDKFNNIFIVLPYGRRDIYSVINNSNKAEFLLEDDIRVDKIQDLLAAHYRGIKQEPRSKLRANMVAVFVDSDGCGELKNVPRGWYRGKTINQYDSSCSVFLVDHGAEIEVCSENIHMLHPNFTRWEKQAIACRIPDTTAVEGADALETAKGIYEMLHHKTLIVAPKSRPDDTNDYCEVLLFDTRRSYGEELVKSGLLDPVELF